MGRRRMAIKVQKKKKLEFIEQANKNNGLIQQTLDEVGVTRYYYDQWLNSDPAFAEEVDLLKTKTRDYVESKLFQLIEEKNPAAIFFWLKTQTKDYREKQYIEQQTTFNQPLKINVIAPEQIEKPTQQQLTGSTQKYITTI